MVARSSCDLLIYSFLHFDVILNMLISLFLYYRYKILIELVLYSNYRLTVSFTHVSDLSLFFTPLALRNAEDWALKF